MRTGIALAIAAQVILFFCSCSSSHRPTDRAIALLADNEVALVQPSSPKAVKLLSLGEEPSSPRVGQYMALGEEELYVLVPEGSPPSGLVQVVDLGKLTLNSTWTLEPVTDFRSISVGGKSGNVYVVGNRNGDLRLVGLSARNGDVVFDWTHHFDDGRDWAVYQALVSDDESTLFVSYHGSNTTGIDVFQLRDGAMECARDPSRPDVACLLGHGRMSLIGNRLYVATGGPQVYVYSANTLAQTLDTALTGNHLMEFAADGEGTTVYVVGSCGYSGGMSVLDLTTGLADSVVAPSPGGHPAAPCGEKLVSGPAGELVVARLPRPVPQPGESIYGSAVDFVGIRDARIKAEVTLPSDPVDLIWFEPQ